MPDSLLPHLQAERAKYGAGLSNTDCVAVLNAVAYGNPGWGLLSKPGGNNGTIDGLGAFVSVDHLVYRPLMRGIDVLSDAGNGGPSTPGWGDVDSGELFPADRFVAPIAPQGQPAPVPDPPPAPTPNPIDLSPILAAVGDLRTTIAVQGVEITHLREAIVTLTNKPASNYTGEVRVRVLGTAKVDLRPV